MLRLALLCHLSAVSAMKLATDVECLPYRTDEVYLELTGAKPQRFLMPIPRLSAPRVAAVTQARPCYTTT